MWFDTTPTRKLGSPTVEFIPREQPGRGRVPRKPRENAEIPWKTYGFDQERTHFAAGMRGRPPFHTLWVTGAGQLIEFPAVVADGLVYVAQLEGRVLALDAATGKIVWDRQYPRCAASSPTIVDGVVYQTFIPRPCNYGPRAVPGLFVAFDAKTGKELWRFTESGPSESSVLHAKGLLYFGDWSGKVYALDPKSRRVRWATQLDDEVDGSAAYSKGRVFIGTNGGSVYALHWGTGEILWQGRSSSSLRFGREYFYATPAVAYGRVFAPNTDGTLYVFGAETGHLLWAQPAGTYIYTAPAIWNETVYVGSYDGSFYAFDAATGRLRWKWEGWGAIHGAPTVLDGLVYFSICGTCGGDAARDVKRGPSGTVALDARTGKLVWRFRDGRYSPVVSDGKRVYMTIQGMVLGLEPCPTRATKGRAGPYRGLLSTC